MKTLYLIVLWFAAMLTLSVAGAFHAAPGQPPIATILAMTLPLVIYLIDRWYLHGVVFGDIHRLDRSTVIFLQVDRVIGVFFLIEYARGHLPSGFALPAGIGDVAVGLAAPWVAYNLASGKPNAVRLATLWNYLGIADLVLAVSMGVTHGDRPLGIFAQAISMREITEYPLSLIPTWAVPLAIILHLRSLQTLHQFAELPATNVTLPMSAMGAH